MEEQSNKIKSISHNGHHTYTYNDDAHHCGRDYDMNSNMSGTSYYHQKQNQLTIGLFQMHNHVQTNDGNLNCESKWKVLYKQQHTS